MPAKAEPPISPIPLEYEEGVVIVQYVPGVTPHGRYAHQSLSPRPSSLHNTFRSTQSGEFWKIEISDGKTTQEVIETLSQDPTVLSVEPNGVRHITTTPNDPAYSLQSYLHPTEGVNAESAWGEQIGSREIIVAVIDTGVDISHPDLAQNIWVNTNEIADNNIDDDGNGYIDDVYGYDFISGDGDPTPVPDGLDNDGFAGADTGVTHGTHVAGIIGAVGNNSLGVSGVNWTTSIMALRVLDDEGAGTDTSIMEAIQYATDNGADIINMSLGGFGSTKVLKSGVMYAARRGVLITAAAGNNAANINNNPFYPICYEHVLGVASVNDDGEPSGFSNFGDDCVDVSAPGELIYSTLHIDETYGLSDGYGYMSGTSMATPVVSGVAALLKSEKSTLKRSRLLQTITDTANSTNLATAYGNGRVDASAALQDLQRTEDPVVIGTITGYTGPQKKKVFTSSTRQKDDTPYFTWKLDEHDADVRGYSVYFGTDPHADPLTEGTFQESRLFSPGNKIRGNNRTYYLRIVAVNALGNSSSDIQQFVYTVDTAVKAPQSMHVERSDDAVRISWDKVSKEHIRSYSLLRREVRSLSSQKKAKSAFRVIATVQQPLHAYVDYRVQPGVRYEYRVKATDDLGNHRRSAIRKSVRFYPRERVVVAAGPGGGPMVRVYNSSTKSFEHSWFAFDVNDRSGVEVAVGNVDADVSDEIIVAQSEGASGEVRVFDANGNQLSAFAAYENGSKGVRLATGDVNGDGKEEIITIPGPGDVPVVKIFRINGTQVNSFSALDGRFRGGAFLTTVDWDSDGDDDIIVSPGPGGGSSVLVYDALSGTLLTQFSAYSGVFLRGIRLSATYQNATPSLLTIPFTGSSHLLQFTNADGAVQQSHPGFFALNEESSELSLAAGNVYRGHFDQFIVGIATSPTSTVRVYTKNGTIKDAFIPFDSFSGPVHVATGWVYTRDTSK